MMTQGELGFKYEEDEQGAGMTGMAGIAPYLDLVCRSGMVTTAYGWLLRIRAKIAGLVPAPSG